MSTVLNADLHLHSRHAIGVSRYMDVPTLAQHAAEKGLTLLGTGDAQHPGWLAHLREHLTEEEDGLYRAANGTLFVTQTELEDKDMVHHLVILPSLDAAEDLGERIAATGANVTSNARPHLRMDGAGIAELVLDVGGIIGPAHAFTPHRSILRDGAFSSIEACYRDHAADVSFLELGLSADTDMADTISSLHKLTFLSCSDAHGPQPHRIGREFVRLRLDTLSFPALHRALERGDVELNVGLDPRLGKYHLSSCTSCDRLFAPSAVPDDRSCLCGGSVRAGVSERVARLADLPEGRHPTGRPPYLRIMPLAELVAFSLGMKGVTSKRVVRVWRQLVAAGESEIAVLVDMTVEDIARVAGEEVALWILAFRKGALTVLPGGGGRYGTFELG